MRKFNTTGLCVPERHYMVDVSDRVEQVRAMVEQGDYFCVNRARQYGKTTLLTALERALAGDYVVASLDFQRLGNARFATEGDFARGMARMLVRKRGLALPDGARSELLGLAEGGEEPALDDLFWALEGWVAESTMPVVLIIDEVDSATNNQVFLDFLAQLRLQYLERGKDLSYPAFKSVILAGVTDVKHLKGKIRPEGESKTNSPWNIATDFKVRMSFDVADVMGMLAQYEADHATGMDVATVAGEIIAWTGGYPFLVSRVCQLAHEGGLGWDRTGIDGAVRMLLRDPNVSLFDSLTRQLEDHPSLKAQLRDVLMEGAEVDFSPRSETQRQLRMLGFVEERAGKLAISNRMFETMLYDYFLAYEQEGPLRREAALGRSRFVLDGRLDMRAVLEGFRRAYDLVYGPIEEGERFSEFDGRRQFLLFLKPIINGTGNFYVEAETRDRTRTDVVVDYLGEQFVVELKIWYGKSRHEEGEGQLKGYLERFGLDVGYLLSFSFNQKKEPGLRRVPIGDKFIWEETI